MKWKNSNLVELSRNLLIRALINGLNYLDLLKRLLIIKINILFYRAHLQRHTSRGRLRSTTMKNSSCAIRTSKSENAGCCSTRQWIRIQTRTWRAANTITTTQTKTCKPWCTTTISFWAKVLQPNNSLDLGWFPLRAPAAKASSNCRNYTAKQLAVSTALARPKLETRRGLYSLSWSLWEIIWI